MKQFPVILFGLAALATFGLRGDFTVAMMLLLKIIIQLNQRSVKLPVMPQFSMLAVRCPSSFTVIPDNLGTSRLSHRIW